MKPLNRQQRRQAQRKQKKKQQNSQSQAIKQVKQVKARRQNQFNLFRQMMGNQFLHDHMTRNVIQKEVVQGKKPILVTRLYDYSKIQIVSCVKDIEKERQFLKKIAKQKQLFIWTQYLHNADFKLQMISIIGFTNRTEAQEQFSENIHKIANQITDVFKQQGHIPQYVYMGQLYQINKYGMFQRKCEQECQLCSTQIPDEDKVLNCCGKSICQKCKIYFKDNLCPFCRQIELRLFAISTQMMNF